MPSSVSCLPSSLLGIGVPFPVPAPREMPLGSARGPSRLWQLVVCTSLPTAVGCQSWTWSHDLPFSRKCVSNPLTSFGLRICKKTQHVAQIRDWEAALSVPGCTGGPESR